MLYRLAITSNFFEHLNHLEFSKAFSVKNIEDAAALNALSLSINIRKHQYAVCLTGCKQITQASKNIAKSTLDIEAYRKLTKHHTKSTLVKKALNATNPLKFFDF